MKSEDTIMKNSDRKTVRLGIIGIGNIGSEHCRNLSSGKCPEIELTAVADLRDARRRWAENNLPAGTKIFSSGSELIGSGCCDAVLVAVPHYGHEALTVEALEHGLDVLCEKPAAVTAAAARRMADTAKRTGRVLAYMFNQRTNCVYRGIRDALDSGDFGQIKRMSWIITDWYRPQRYYDSGSWRATWAGEGGGVLLNQCPHQLDLWQWLCGMPSKVKAICHEGKWHDIEVEDDVSIYVEYPNGATGTFITTTGDCPGTNRLEITLDKAKILVENGGKITLYELEKPLSEHIYSAKGGFDRNPCAISEVETDGKNEQHVGVMNAFAAHILHGEPLVAEGAEGINGLTISNAAFLSSWLDETVTLPIDEDLFYEKLQEKIKNSTHKKVVVEQVQADMSNTF